MDNQPAGYAQPLSNKEYLDQIAVKGKVKNSGPILSPLMIKIIAAAAVFLIAIVVIGNAISGSNSQVKQSFERIYSRITFISGSYPVEDVNNISSYTERIHNSDLRMYAIQLNSSLMSTVNELETTPDLGFDVNNITASVDNEELDNLIAYADKMDESILLGTVDRAYATETNYQISTLIAYEQNAREKTNSQAFADILDKSIDELTVIKTNFDSWLSTNY